MVQTKKIKNKILTIEGNYHGRTLGASLMVMEAFIQQFGQK